MESHCPDFQLDEASLHGEGILGLISSMIRVHDINVNSLNLRITRFHESNESMSFRLNAGKLLLRRHSCGPPVRWARAFTANEPRLSHQHLPWEPVKNIHQAIEALMASHI